MSTIYGVTGASGQLGKLVVERLLSLVPGRQIVALTRDPSSLASFEAHGVAVRPSDFDDLDALRKSFTGINRLLLISTSQMGKRERQHTNAIEAAKEAGIDFVAYTSVLHADTFDASLAEEHRATEAVLSRSGLKFASLRHGWYLENTVASSKANISRGVVVGSSGKGRQSAATRDEYAAADVAILTDPNAASGIYELAGDTSFDMEEYASLLTSISGQQVRYIDMLQDEYKRVLVGAGLPDHVADVVSDASVKSANNVLQDDSHTLSRLIGRPTTDLRTAITAALH